MIGGGNFDAFAVSSRKGPHVTLQAGVFHLGRHWTTTTRRSVKAAAIARVGRASATTGGDGRWRVIGGAASVLDPGSLSSLVEDPASSALAGGALLRLGLGRLDQLLGYAEVGTAVPDSFLPAGRVLLVTQISDELVLKNDEVVGGKGRWAGVASDVEPGPKRRGPWKAALTFASVPDEIVALAEQPRSAWLGVDTASGAVALPAQWDPTAGCVQVSRHALGAIAARLPGAVCVTLDDSSSRRPDEKLGVMLRGTGGVVDTDATSACVSLKIERVTYWSGFDSQTPGQVA